MFQRALAIAGIGLLIAAPCQGLEDGTAITSNDFRVDVTRTAVSGPARKIAMGGAYVALAEGVAALHENPASAAYRSVRSTSTWDFDFLLGQVSVSRDDVFNDGQGDDLYDAQRVFDIGPLVQRKRFGIGFIVRTGQFDYQNAGRNDRFETITGEVAVGYSFQEGELALGLGVQPVSLKGTADGGSGERFLDLSGSGFCWGVLWHPRRGPLRIGASYQGRIKKEEEFVVQGSSPTTAAGLILPSEVTTAPSASLGIAYEWRAPSVWPYRRTILSTDVRWFGVSHNAIGLSSFLQQTVQQAGQKDVFSLHAGLEVEPLPNRLRLRLGTYREPSRYAGVSVRQHATAGLELGLFRFRFFGERLVSLSYSADIASRYNVHALSLWLWNFG